MVPAAVVDPVLADVTPLLEAGDIVIDGGNSYYHDDIRRAGSLRDKGPKTASASLSPRTRLALACRLSTDAVLWTTKVASKTFKSGVFCIPHATTSQAAKMGARKWRINGGAPFFWLIFARL